MNSCALNPSFAEVSKNKSNLFSFEKFFPSSKLTCLFESKSFLFPIKINFISLEA